MSVAPRISLLVLTWALAAAAQPADSEKGTVVDRAVALVNGRVITLSELEFEARVAFVQLGATQAATAPLDDQALASALELGIAQRLQAQEAEKLQAFRVEPAELETAIRAFQERFPSRQAFEAFLARHEADMPMLAGVLERILRSHKVLDSKIRLRAQVSESEVRQYFDEHARRLGGRYEDLRAPLRDKLIRERYDKLAKAEVAQLRKAADVRLLAPFARAKGEGKAP